MQISLRSQMAAGVAALGATAIAITPITQPDVLPSLQRVSANVSLTASIANPINAIAGVLQDINTDIFNQSDLNVAWPDAFLGDPSAPSDPNNPVYAPGWTGLIPNTANQLSTGPLTALINNLSGYAWAGIRGVGVIGSGTSAALFNTPFALVTAIGQLAGGDPQAALDTLKTQILGPLQLGITGALDSIGYIVDNVIANAGTVITSFVPFLLKGVFDTTTVGGQYIVQSAINTLGTAFSALTSLDIPTAWNAVVNGFLGRNGTLGQLESLTIGAGILQGSTVAIPSYRAVITSELQRLGDFQSNGYGGIYNDPFSPPPGPPPGAAVKSAATKRVAPAAAVDAAAVTAADVKAEASTTVDAPTATTAASDNSGSATAGDNGSASTKSASKHRVSRKAASDN